MHGISMSFPVKVWVLLLYINTLLPKFFILLLNVCVCVCPLCMNAVRKTNAVTRLALEGNHNIVFGTIDNQNVTL
jgi:hypothetical protein